MLRGWSERMGPGFMGRQNMGMSALNPHAKSSAQPGPPALSPAQAMDAQVSYAFNVPFASDLAGPNTEDILHATTDAVERWTHPLNAPDDVPVYKLPVHAQGLEALERFGRSVTAGPEAIEAHVDSSVGVRGQLVTTVCLTGPAELVHRTREAILQDLPISLRCTTIDVEGHLVCDFSAGVLRKEVTNHLDYLSGWCGVDIFLLGPKLSPMVDGMTGDAEMRVDQRWRLAVYGDVMASEHAKVRILTQIDALLGRIVDGAQIDHSMQQSICGRHRRNIKLIESATGTAIYFPAPLSQLYRYCRPKAHHRKLDDVFITGEKPEHIAEAKSKLHELATRIRLFVGEAAIAPAKIDSIILHRLDTVRKIAEANATYVMLPPLGKQSSIVRVQGSDQFHVQRTVREIMALTGQFYGATWFVKHPDPRSVLAGVDVKAVLVGVCASSDADVSFSGMAFSLTGSDDSVKEAFLSLSEKKFLAHSQAQISVKIELANEHKEFVSGKKNGKINKIMGQCSVQIMFDGFNEVNFNIEVMANSYDTLKKGLGLVEQEMPASISFHVPDQYHKRIIGIGGQHIQRIMKKYSVFVKFSNAMDRGGMGREDDEVKVDNVICRTPARNAQNLDAVKNEILEMVDRADSEFTSQVVNIDRLYHRQLLVRLRDIDALESKYNCKIVFPSTEQASDEVTVTGPQWQVPHCVDEFLGMVPDKHELVLARSEELVRFLESPAFADLVHKLKSQHEVEVTVLKSLDDYVTTDDDLPTVTLLWTFTRNNAGGLRDAIDFLQSQITTSGIEVSVVRGSIPRPKSDSFEESFQYFDSKILQNASAPVAADSPTKPGFGDEVARERSTIFDRLRKPGSMSSISSFLDRRKNSSHSANNSFFKGSANVSKSSLISIESTRSFNADRNPWNDSGVNLADEESPWGRPNGAAAADGKPVPGSSQPGDATPRHHPRASADSGRPSTSHSVNSGYHGPAGPYR